MGYDAPTEMPAPSELEIRVYYEDTDAGAVVYYANYLRFFERARTEWLRANGIDQRSLAAQSGLVFVVRRADIAYRQPAYLDDLLLLRSSIVWVRACAMQFRQQAWRGAELIAQAEVEICCVDAASMRPMRFPPAIRELFTRNEI